MGATEHRHPRLVCLAPEIRLTGRDCESRAALGTAAVAPSAPAGAVVRGSECGIELLGAVLGFTV